MQGNLSIERMCELAKVSRAGFYRSLQEQRPQEEDTEVRSAIQAIALGHRRRYGYRRVAAELKRRGMQVNHKRVARIMREDNLLAVQPRQFVTTTDSGHALEIYLNLAWRMKLTGIDQLWVADITYIRLQAEFVYLAVVLDGYSRRVVGWKLDRTLTSRLAIEALQGAIASRRPPPGLVHHSDRGVQYASAEYVAILTGHGMVSSMSRPANPYDNASCESFIKTLKREEFTRTTTRPSNNCGSRWRSSSSGITTSSGCTLLSVTVRRTSSSKNPAAPERQRYTLRQSCSGRKLRKFFRQECWRKGLKRRPFPRPHPCLENQQDDSC